MSNKGKQQHLELFDGKKVELTSVKFVGDPDRIINRNEHGSNVAYIVLGSTDGVAFSANQDHQIVRDEKCKMSRVFQIDYADGLSMLDELDRKSREAQGIHELPFDDLDLHDGVTCPECKSSDLRRGAELTADEAICAQDCITFECRFCGHIFEEPK